MTLFAAWSEIVADGAPHFPQPRTFRRAARQALGSLLCVGRRCLSRIIWTQGRPHRSWSSEYFLHSRCRWEPQSLFAGVWRRALPYCPGRLVGVAIDDTRLRKTGRAIPQARYHRDPLSPPFHVNLMRGLRFLQASLLLPLHRRGNVSCRALPVRFEEAAPLKKPSRKAGAEAWQEYKRMSKRHNLSQRLVQMMASLRQALDEAGGRAKLLVLALDGSFCNRTCFRAARDRTELIARARKDARLGWRAASPSRRFYALSSFTPEQVRQDESYLWKPTQIFYGGKRRRIRYQEVTQIYWRRGAGQIPLRLFVVAPTPYRKRKSSKLYYRQPAYLLSTDLRHSAPPVAANLLRPLADRSQRKLLFREPLWPRLPTRSSFVPYILSAHDIGRLLKLAGQLDRPPFRAALYRALLLLLYCTGLRFGEALRLRIRDVHTRQGTVFVETFKGRARWVPFDRSLARELNKYLAARRTFASAQPDERFFVGVNKTRLPVKTA